MSYNTIEVSEHDGSPIELYLLRYQGLEWAYSNGGPYSWEGINYIPNPVGRSAKTQTKDIHKSSLEVLIPRNSELSLIYLTGAPESVVSLTIFRAHMDVESWPIVYWKGRVTSMDWPNAVTAKLICESVYSSLQRPGLRAIYQRMCRHALYSPQCGVNKATFAVSGRVDYIEHDGRSIYVYALNGYDAGWFSGGMVLTSDGTYLFIEHFSDGTLYLAHPCNLQEYDNITVYPGCARNMDTCKNKFNNVLNYGGFPWIPGRNPFDGRSIV